MHSILQITQSAIVCATTATRLNIILRNHDPTYAPRKEMWVQKTAPQEIDHTRIKDGLCMESW
jgi:hypothetical protein